MRARLLLLAVVALALVAGVVPARAADPPPNGGTLVDGCNQTAGAIPEAGPRGCRTLQAFVWGAGRTCRMAGLPADACTGLDGRQMAEANMTAYEQSWTHRALSLQRQLDIDVPLQQGLVPHTHNSFNSAAYGPTLSNSDPNQLYSMTNQLRMDMRGIEIDVHWAPSPTADAGDNGMAPIMCHGEPVPAGPVTVHAGCTIEGHLRDGLTELRTWLDAREQAGDPQFLLLYLENNLDGVAAAHNAVARTIEHELGDRVYRPPAGQPCAPMPMDLTPRQIMAGGARVLIVGNCGPAGSGWNAWVHERGPRWEESSSGPGDDYPAFAGCPADRATYDYDHKWIRRYEDSTWLSAMAAGASSQVTFEETRRMVRCGVQMPGFDQLYPEDPRLAQLVWSWAPDQPASTAPACAAQSGDGRWRAESCAQRHQAACVMPDGTWRLGRATLSWKSGPNACRALARTARFAAPVNGWQNELLRAAAGTATVWLNSTQLPSGSWAANR